MEIPRPIPERASLTPREQERFENLPLICLLGPMAGGKGTLGEVLVNEFGFTTASFSQGIRESLKQWGVPEPYERTQLQAQGRVMKEIHGSNILARLATKNALNSAPPDKPLGGIVLDGMRGLPEVKHFAELPNSTIIWVTADDAIRRERILARARPGDTTAENFDLENEREHEWIAPLRECADFIYENNGRPEEAQEFIRQVVMDRYLAFPVNANSGDTAEHTL